jgi:propanol-preferring alcohol dehydrogenase
VTSGEGADATLNVSDHETAVATSAAVMRMYGLLIQIAQPDNVVVPFQELIFRDIRIHGSLTGKSCLTVQSQN